MAQPISPIAVVANVMAKYDHNRDGVIDLKGRTGAKGFWDKLANKDERIDRDTKVTGFGDTLNISTSVTTHDRLFYAADRNPQNGKVTRQELEDFVKQYDTNKDGQLSRRGLWGWLTRKPQGEYNIFNREFGARTTSYSNVGIDLSTPKKSE